MIRTALASPLWWHGSKGKLASSIIARMPKHTHYVEPFAGSLAVLLAKDPTGVSEVVNDLDGRLANFWSVLRDPEQFRQFARLAEATPFSEADWNTARAEVMAGLPDDRPFVRAFHFFVFCRQSMAGRMLNFSPLTRARTRRGMNEQAAIWLNTVDRLPDVHSRLMRVVVRCNDALKVIHREDGPETLFYCDPPYLHDTRVRPGPGNAGYACEMSDEQHEKLLGTLALIKGKFLLSGYRSPLYDAAAKRFGWRRTDFDVEVACAGSRWGGNGKGRRKAVESLWFNF